MARPELAAESLVNPEPWHLKKDRIYDGMADLIGQHLNLEPILNYLSS
jgi:hypothetical protein